MITNERAYYIARDWIDAWNRRDLPRVLNYYSSNIQHTSPLVIQFTRGINCTIKGKRRLRQYFFAGMFRLNGTQFKLHDILLGVDSLSIIYEAKGTRCVETMFLNKNGKVYRSHAYYV